MVTKIAGEQLEHSLLELILADLKNDDVFSHKNVKLFFIEEVQERDRLTYFGSSAQIRKISTTMIEIMTNEAGKMKIISQ